MGCNSHIFAEIRHAYRTPKETSSHWSMWGEISECRDYNVYAAMAGVRVDIPKPVAKPRGLPKDVGYEVVEQFKEAGGDYHTPTWLTGKEFIEAIDSVVAAREAQRERAERYWGKGKPLIDPPWRIAKKLIQAMIDEYGELRVRVVIGFDN